MLGSINNDGIVSWFKLYKFGKTDEILGKVFNQDLLFVNDLFDEDVKQKTDRITQVILDRNLGFGVYGIVEYRSNGQAPRLIWVIHYNNTGFHFNEPVDYMKRFDAAINPLPFDSKLAYLFLHTGDYAYEDVDDVIKRVNEPFILEGCVPQYKAIKDDDPCADCPGCCICPNPCDERCCDKNDDKTEEDKETSVEDELDGEQDVSIYTLSHTRMIGTLPVEARALKLTTFKRKDTETALKQLAYNLKHVSYVSEKVFFTEYFRPGDHSPFIGFYERDEEGNFHAIPATTYLICCYELTKKPLSKEEIDKIQADFDKSKTEAEPSKTAPKAKSEKTDIAENTEKPNESESKKREAFDFIICIY